MGNPQHLRPCCVLFPEAGALRCRALQRRLRSAAQAAKALGVSDATFEAARDQGRMMSKTRDRLLAALDEVGA